MLKEIFQTTMHSLVSICVLFTFTRIMGKKQVSQLTFFDYVSGISIGSIAAAFAVDETIGYTKGLTGLVVYALFPILLSYASLKSFTIRKLLDGKPSILIQNGKIVDKNLKKSKMNLNDLLEECRLNSVFNINEIEFAILETSGKLSILLKPENQPLTTKDMNITVDYKGICVNVIVDGKVLYKHLKEIGKDEQWLKKQLKAKGISDLSNVILAYTDSKGTFYAYLKGEIKNVPPIM